MCMYVYIYIHISNGLQELAEGRFIFPYIFCISLIFFNLQISCGPISLYLQILGVRTCTFKKTEVQLIYNIVLVSCVQQTDSAIHIYVCIFFFYSFPLQVIKDTEYSSLCCTVNPCCLYCLNFDKNILIFYFKINENHFHSITVLCPSNTMLIQYHFFGLLPVRSAEGKNSL